MGVTHTHTLREKERGFYLFHPSAEQRQRQGWAREKRRRGRGAIAREKANSNGDKVAREKVNSRALCPFQNVQIDTAMLPRNGTITNLQVVRISPSRAQGKLTLMTF